MTHFVGVIDGAGKNWGVRFPDVDGCVGAGASPEEAIASASEALRDVMSSTNGREIQLMGASWSALGQPSTPCRLRR